MKYRRCDRDNRALMLRRISRALGVAITTATLAAACGGNVVVEKAGSGTGASGGGGEGTGGTTPFVCDGMGSELRYLCLPGSIGLGCPSFQDARDTLMEQVYGTSECEGSGTCCDPSGAGCGPDPNAPAQCCYQVGVDFYGCEGRPFVIDGEARTARITRRDDWRDATLTPNVDGLDDATRLALADAYARSALFEHASVASFARFAIELMSVGAPAHLLDATTRAMTDEVLHARLCFGLAGAYAGAPVGPSALAMAPGDARVRGAEDIAAAVVIEGCINETVAAMVAAAERDRAEDPAVKAALTKIADDEASHAELAWSYATWAMKNGGEGVRRAIERAFQSGVRMDGEPPLPNANADAMRAHGKLTPEERRAVMESALAEVVMPSARALLAAGKPPSLGAAHAS